MARLPAIATLILALLIGASCGSPSSPDVSPTTPSPSAAGTPGPSTPITSYRFLYREFGPEEDTIWSVSPLEPSKGDRIATIAHRAEWGIIPALAPDGQRLAYTTFPPRAFDTGSQAEAYVLDLETGQTHLVAQEVDLRMRPLWSPDGSLLFLRRTTDEQVSILALDMPAASGSPSGPRVLLQADVSQVFTFIPFGFTADGRSMYVTRVESSGATVVVVSLSAGSLQATPVLRISADQFARDYHLSPDSRRLAFLVQEMVEGRLLFRTHIADLAEKSITALEGQGLSPADHLRPLWHPDGRHIAVGQPPSSGQPGAVALVPLGGGSPSFLPAPARGFDVPLSWSPDGSVLAVISFDGSGLANPGRATLVMVTANGQRLSVGRGVDIEVVGWVKE